MSPHEPQAGAAPPVIPRPAASLLVLRETEGNVAVLMGLRGAKHRFMPNRLVFPGGGVDPEDFVTVPGSPLSDGVLRRLTRSAAPELAAALGVAAARELDEETGLTLGRPPALDGLDYLCRAVTPESSPVRFDARFFVVSESRISGDMAGSGELEGLRYYELAETLALDLAFATRSVLDRLRAWLQMSTEERVTRLDVPVLQNRSWISE